jgi:hypothetical protein
VGLAEAIKALRSELTSSMAEGSDKELKFRLGPVEMEFAVAVTREAGGEAGVKFWVVSLGGKGTLTSETTHRVTLQLQPLAQSGQDFVINDTVDGPVTGVD